MRSKTFVVVSLAAALVLGMVAGASPAQAETHPFLFSFGSLENPNGIAVDESSGNVYVADVSTNTVYKFDAKGNPVEFLALKSSALTGSATSAGSFAFPTEPRGTPAAIAVDNSKSSSDPSVGDLYVMDATHGVIDKFNASGAYLSQITGFAPASGGLSEDELLGLAIDENGNLRVDRSTELTEIPAIDLFDDSGTNHLVTEERNVNTLEINPAPPGGGRGYGFAVGPTEDQYLLYNECSCLVKFGQQLAPLGRVDEPQAGDVAVAADLATGHLYIAGQSFVKEWDTGAINGSDHITGTLESESSATPVGEFGSLQLSASSGQGGIAVNGSSGDIYVSNPADGKVYVFGSDVPAVTASAATNVAREIATLNGTVDPRGVPITSCQFQYGVAPEFGKGGAYDHSVSCKQTAGEMGSGASAVPVSADLEGLQPGQFYHFHLKVGNDSGSSESSGLFATAGVGFGVKSFEVSFLNKDGTPDTQAGSHPYEMVTNIVFNSRFLRAEPGADSLYLNEPNGTLKDLVVDLPPGLIGDPNATAKKCTLKQLDGQGNGNECPIESQLGTLRLEWSLNVPLLKLAADSWNRSRIWYPRAVSPCSWVATSLLQTCSSTTAFPRAGTIPYKLRSRMPRRRRRCSAAG